MTHHRALRKGVALTLAFAFVGVLVGASIGVGSTGTPEPDPKAIAQVIARGLEVYKELGCGGCHTLSAAGSHGTIGPNQDRMGSVAAARVLGPNYQGNATDAAGYLEESITAPNAYVARAGFGPPNKFMPSYKTLSPEDLHALVQLLLAQQEEERTKDE